MKIKTVDIFGLDTVAPLFDQYRVFYGQPCDLDAAKRFLHERLINQQSIILLAQDEAGAALGFTQLYPTFSSVSMRKKYILNDLFVAPQARQMGAGAALLEQAKAVALAAGAVALTLSTAVSNHTAQSLYRANGWQLDKEFLNFDFSLRG